MEEAMFSFDGGWRPVEAPNGRGRTYRKLLDCQNEEVVERFDGEPIVPSDNNSSQHPLLSVADLRELRIRLNPPKTTTADVLFLLEQLDEARAEHPMVVAPQELNCAIVPSIDVKAWLAARSPLNSSYWR